MDAPITFSWDGEVMRPLPRFTKACDKQFVVGETYPLEVREERSSNSHRHYFAAMHDAWLNLPNEISEQFPTSEHLRRWALIKGGFCETTDHACSSNEEARKLAAFIAPIDTYAVVEVRGDIVRLHRAKSQSVRSMDKATFQQSKQTVLEIVSELIGTSAAELGTNAGAAA